MLRRANIVLSVVAVAAWGQAVPPGTAADIRERTRPFGELCLEGEDCGGVEPAPAPPAQGLSGAEIYEKHCAACHAAGLNEAPKTGDAEAWRPRLAKGMDALLRTTREGLNLMPANGLCMTCSDDELLAAIEHMIGTP